MFTLSLLPTEMAFPLKLFDVNLVFDVSIVKNDVRVYRASTAITVISIAQNMKNVAFNKYSVETLVGLKLYSAVRRLVILNKKAFIESPTNTLHLV